MIVLKSITINGICLTSCKCLVTWLTYVIISCFNKMSLCANVSFRSIDSGILNNLGPIHHPNVDGIEPVLLREMACDFLCIGLFPESALILSFNLHQNEPLVTNFKSVQWLWKKNIIQEKSFEKGSLQIGHIIQASRCWEICTRVSLLLNWMCSQLMFFCWYVYYGILFSLRFQIRASWPYVLIIYFTISWTHCIMLNCSVEIWVCVTELPFCLLFVYYTVLICHGKPSERQNTVRPLIRDAP